MEADADFILVSDFHLASGESSADGNVNPREEFFSDAPFARFVDTLWRRGLEENRRWRLVLLGDVFDFLRVRAAESNDIHESTSNQATQQKLERMAAGHPLYFAALRRFLASGHQIDILPGNHDLEWIRTETQEAMKDLLAGSDANIRARIVFHPWILYVPGLLYAEHGQQYHSVNALPYLLTPYPHGNRSRLILPFGSYLETYLLELLETIFPGQTMPPGMAILRRAAREKPGKLLAALPLHIRFAARLVQSVVKGLLPSAPGASKEYRHQVLPSYSREVGIPINSLRAIHQLSSTNILSRLPHLFNLRGDHPSDHYLYRASQKINALLENDGMQVPFYAFGHTHAPLKTQIHPARTEAYYLNCGSWAGRSLGRYPFIEIHHETASRPKAAFLLAWDEHEERIMPYAVSSG